MCVTLQFKQQHMFFVILPQFNRQQQMFALILIQINWLTSIWETKIVFPQKGYNEVTLSCSL